MELKNLKALNQVSTYKSLLICMIIFNNLEITINFCYYFQFFENNTFRSLNISENKITFRVNL